MLGFTSTGASETFYSIFIKSIKMYPLNLIKSLTKLTFSFSALQTIPYPIIICGAFCGECLFEITYECKLLDVIPDGFDVSKNVLNGLMNVCVYCFIASCRRICPLGMLMSGYFPKI